MQWTALGEQRIDSASDVRVFDQRRSVVGFAAGVDDERASAAPMLLMDERAEAGHVSSRVRASECRPQPIIDRSRGKLAVIDECDERERVDRRVCVEVSQELTDRSLLLAVTGTESGVERWGRDHEHTRHRDAWIAEAVRQ